MSEADMAEADDDGDNQDHECEHGRGGEKAWRGEPQGGASLAALGVLLGSPAPLHLPPTRDCLVLPGAWRPSPVRMVEKKSSQKRQRMGAATTWFTAPEWIFLSNLAGR